MDDISDLFIIGGGINGCGIARDAAGRGLSVTLAEMGDLGSATSSASTKLFHGGLRYLDYFEFRLVRESLAEREVLLRAMPHIAWPMRFVLPLSDAMRFDTETPAARLLARLMPWLKGRRPPAMIRAGLFLYDHLGGRKILPGTRGLDLRRDPAGAVLRPEFTRAFEYSDVWVEDSRLVILNARDAKRLGARILTRTKVTQARREGDLWHIATTDGQFRARMLVNAAGPWVGDTLRGVIGSNSREAVRLVRGSHVVTRRLFDHDRCYFFQGADGRIIFAIPYEQDFTLIGTTDQDHPDPDTRPQCTDAEADYLLSFASRYFARAVTRDDIVWRYSGVRPLYDDGQASATAATRDYVLSLERGGAPVLHVFGGKITTYRRLAEAALDEIGACLAVPKGSWTEDAPLPGGDFPHDSVQALTDDLRRTYPFLTAPWAARLIRAYGTEAAQMLGAAKRVQDLGREFGATLTEAELRWLIDREFARGTEDVIWRRSKLGLRLSPAQVQALDDWFAGRNLS